MGAGWGRGSGLGVRAMERRLACTYLDGDEFLRSLHILVSTDSTVAILHPRTTPRVCAQFSQLSKGSHVQTCIIYFHA